MLSKKEFDFEIITENDEKSWGYSAECSGSRSDCCTRVCTRDGVDSRSLNQEWERYLEVNAGVVQY